MGLFSASSKDYLAYQSSATKVTMDRLTFFQQIQETPLFNSIFCSLFLFSILYLLQIRRRSRLNLPPCPPRLPFIGNLHQIGRPMHRSLQILSAKYGPVMHVKLGGHPMVVVSSADLAKKMMSQEVFAGRIQTTVSDALFYGNTDILFSPYGEYWREARKICVFELLSQKRVQGFQPAREEEVSKMINKLRVSSTEEGGVNLGELFDRISNNIVSRCALGGVYERENSEKSFGDLTRNTMDLISALCFRDFFPLLGWLDVVSGLSAKVRRTSHELDAFLDKVIEEHRIAGSYNRESDKHDFVDIILGIQTDGLLSTSLTQENTKAILLDMFVAGTDTTSATMEWAMAELVKNPKTMKTAQEEVRGIVGSKSEIELSDINQMDYLKCVLKETLRLHPPTAFSGRQTTAAVKLEGYDIPPKTAVMINLWAIQRDPEIWDEPDEFCPERFLNRQVDFRGKDKELMPFGGGRRSCPGMLFAVAEAEYMLANLLYWFDWDLPDGISSADLDMTDVFGTIIRKSIPLCLIPRVHLCMQHSPDWPTDA